MKEFLLLFRRDPKDQPDPGQNPGISKSWQEWMKNIIDQGSLSQQGNRLENSGTVVHPDGVTTDGPYVELKESVGGYTIIKTDSLHEAAELAKGCPILKAGGSVEVRPVMTMDTTE